MAHTIAVSQNSVNSILKMLKESRLLMSSTAIPESKVVSYLKTTYSLIGISL